MHHSCPQARKIASWKVLVRVNSNNQHLWGGTDVSRETDGLIALTARGFAANRAPGLDARFGAIVDNPSAIIARGF